MTAPPIEPSALPSAAPVSVVPRRETPPGRRAPPTADPTAPRTSVAMRCFNALRLLHPSPNAGRAAHPDLGEAESEVCRVGGWYSAIHPTRRARR